MTITDFEDKITLSRNNFRTKQKEFIKLLKSEFKDSDLQSSINELHNSFVDYTNLFERSISEYGLSHFKQDENIQSSKLNSSINLCNTILKYWKTIKKLDNKIPNIVIPKPQNRAYTSIQSYIKYFDSKKSQDLISEFKKENLPIQGFNSKQNYTDMTKKKQMIIGFVIGLVMLLLMVVLVLKVDCPTELQNNVFMILLALAGGAFSMILTGTINFNNKLITAGGAFAIVVLIYFVKPIQISDYKSCEKTLSGSVYFGGKPLDNAQILILEQNMIDNTNQFGNFKLNFNFDDINNNELKLLVKKEGKYYQIDTTVILSKLEIDSGLNIEIPKYCLECEQTDSSGNILNQKSACSGNQKYIQNYIKGFTRAGQEQGRIVNCKRAVY